MITHKTFLTIYHYLKKNLTNTINKNNKVQFWYYMLNLQLAAKKDVAWFFTAQTYKWYGCTTCINLCISLLISFYCYLILVVKVLSNAAWLVRSDTQHSNIHIKKLKINIQNMK